MPTTRIRTALARPPRPWIPLIVGVAAAAATIAVGLGIEDDTLGQVVLVSGLLVAVLLAATLHLGIQARWRARSLELINQDLLREMEERKRAEAEQREYTERLQEAEKHESLARLSGGVAHDFNNLLVTVMGSADLARATVGADGAAREHLDAISQAAGRAAELCRQLVRCSGREPLSLRPLSLGSLVDRARDDLRERVDGRARINYGLADDLPSVEGDRNLLRSVLVDLVTNAVEAISGDEGVIFIGTGIMECDRFFMQNAIADKVHPPGSYVYLEVSDNGAGMDRETQKRLFEPFFSTHGEGRGLGLSAALGVVCAHKGAMKLFSTPARGTTIKVLFPASERPARPDTASLGPIASQLQLHGTVLVIDDEPAVIETARGLLEKAGMSVLTAPGGAEGIEVFEKNAHVVSCIVLDLTMPGLDGEHTLPGLRAINPDVPVVLSSGFHPQDALQRFVGKGFDGFLEKPYDYTTLVGKLRAVLWEEGAEPRTANEEVA